MNRICLLYLLALITITIDSYSNSVCSQTKENEAGFLAKYKAKVETLRSNYGRPFVLNGTVDNTTSFTDKTNVLNTTNSVVKFNVKQTENCYLFEIVTDGSEKSTAPSIKKVVQSLNSQYAFKANNTGNGWAMVQYDDRHPPVLNPRSAATNGGYNYQPLAWTIGGHELPDVIGTTKSKILQLDYPDASTAKLTFSLEKDTESQPENIALKKCTVYFDMDNLYRIKSFDFSTTSGPVLVSTTGIISYDKQTGFISKFTQEGKISNGYSANLDITTDSISLQAPDEQEFTLTAYGIPDPPGVTREETTSNWLWAAAGLNLFAVLTMLFVFLARRAKRKDDAPPPPPVIS